MYRGGLYDADRGRTISDSVITSQRAGVRKMPDQPDFDVTARIPTGQEHTREEVPQWCDFVLEVSDPDDPDEPWTLTLTRAAGELIISASWEALHPNAGGNLRDRLWEDLDALMDVVMDDPRDLETKGKAAGIARAIALMMNPYDEDALDAIREEAIERWESSHSQ